MATILQGIPKEADVTKIDYEGPRIAIYTKKPRYLMEHNEIISNMVNLIKKRIVVRTEESIRKSEEEARQILTQSLPKEAELGGTFFDTAIGEMTVEVKRPWLLFNNAAFNIAELVEKTGWRFRVRKATTIQSQTIQTINYNLKISSAERSKHLKQVGEKIFRPKLSEDAEVSLMTLGGFSQVGRSCMLLTTHESKILIDCGVNPGAKSAMEAYPRLDWANITLDELDGVVISHAHLDHTGFLPTLFKYGYKGPVYCTEPTLPLMTLLQNDSVKIAKSNGTYIPYETRDVNEVIKRTITLPYGKPTDISPDITITFNNAGHIMGSATVHINVFGTHNILYSGDYKYARTQLLDSAVSVYPRVETLITESTYGNSADIMPDQSV